MPSSLDDSDLEWAASDTPQANKTLEPRVAAPRQPASTTITTRAPTGGGGGGRARRDADGRYVRPQLDSPSDSDSELESAPIDHVEKGKRATAMTRRAAPATGARPQAQLAANGGPQQQQPAQRARGFQRLLSVQLEADELVIGNGDGSDGTRGRASSDAPDGSSESDARSQQITETTVRRKSGQRLSGGQLSLNSNLEVYEILK